MKTREDFKKININEYAFFKGVSILEAKNEFTKHVFPSDWLKLHKEMISQKKESKYLTKSLSPKISSKEYVCVNNFDFSIHSNSNLDGSCQLLYLCDYYNKGVSLQKLREYSQNESFSKQLKFTGVKSVVNDILNRDQLLIVQKSWILSNTYMKNVWSKKCIEFIDCNDWALKHLKDNNISEDFFIKQKQLINYERNTKKTN